MDDFIECQPKIALAIPHTGLVTFKWAQAFRELHLPFPSEVVTTANYSIAQARNKLVEKARKISATHIFFLDSDTIPPQDGLVRLMKHKKHVTAGVVGVKRGTGPNVFLVDPNERPDYLKSMPIEDLVGENDLFSAPPQRMLLVGAACLLIDMKVFSRLSPPYFWYPSPEARSGEDVVFCVKLYEANIPIHVDPAVKCVHTDFDGAWSWDGKFGLTERAY